MKSFKPGTRARRHKGYRGGPPTAGQYPEAHPRPRGGAGEHFPPWVNSAQAHNWLSFNDLLHNLPDVVERMGNDPRYMPDRYAFKKVRSKGSPYWGKLESAAFAA